MPLSYMLHKERNRMNCIDITTTIMTWSGTIVGIASLIITVVIAKRTKRVEDAVSEKEEELKKKRNLRLNRKELHEKLCTLAKQFSSGDENTDRKDQISECDQALADLERWFTKEESDLVKNLRESLNKQPFTASRIVSDLHDIITILNEEDY